MMPNISSDSHSSHTLPPFYHLPNPLTAPNITYNFSPFHSLISSPLSPFSLSLPSLSLPSLSLPSLSLPSLSLPFSLPPSLPLFLLQRCDHSGYLTKLDSRLRPGKRRWFVLAGSELRYYRNKESSFGRPRKTINLNSWCKLAIVDNVIFKVCDIIRHHAHVV